MTASVWILAYLGQVPGKVPNQVAGRVPGQVPGHAPGMVLGGKAPKRCSPDGQDDARMAARMRKSKSAALPTRMTMG